MTVLGWDCAPREGHDFFERSDDERRTAQHAWRGAGGSLGAHGTRCSVEDDAPNIRCGSSRYALPASRPTASRARRSPTTIRLTKAIGTSSGSGPCSRCAWISFPLFSKSASQRLRRGCSPSRPSSLRAVIWGLGFKNAGVADPGGPRSRCPPIAAPQPSPTVNRGRGGISEKYRSPKLTALASFIFPGCGF
jgi:hypothetical protein